MVVALSGRRIDETNTGESRFPLANVELVRSRIRSLLKSRHAVALVSSAACGADLIALSEAGALGLTRRIVLPSNRTSFKEGSVIDRPGNWGALYDQILDEVSADGNLIVMDPTSEGSAYSAAVLAILDEAGALANKLGTSSGAMVVWNGSPRTGQDISEEFRAEADKRHWPMLEVLTL